MKRLRSNMGMKANCRLLLLAKGAVQPSCSCGACWDYYFYKNEPKYNAARKALEELGEEAVFKGQFQMHAESILAQIREEFEGMAEEKLVKLLQLTRSQIEFITAQATRFLTQLKRAMRQQNRTAAAAA